MKLLSNKQIRLLELLENEILSCKDCELHKNGRAKPYWTPMSEYVIVGEAPGENEIKIGEPFVGKAGKILGKSMSKYGYRKHQFAIINSVNCRPVTSTGSNGKPTKLQVEYCKKWLRKFITILDPEKALSLGSYAMSSLSSHYNKITEMNGSVDLVRLSAKMNRLYVIYSVHPAYAIYNKEKGTRMLEESIRNFQELQV